MRLYRKAQMLKIRLDAHQKRKTMSYRCCKSVSSCLQPADEDRSICRIAKAYADRHVRLSPMYRSQRCCVQLFAPPLPSAVPICVRTASADIQPFYPVQRQPPCAQEKLHIALCSTADKRHPA